jgi:hypothetical protein
MNLNEINYKELGRVGLVGSSAILFLCLTFYFFPWTMFILFLVTIFASFSLAIGSLILDLWEEYKKK